MNGNNVATPNGNFYLQNGPAVHILTHFREMTNPKGGGTHPQVVGFNRGQASFLPLLLSLPLSLPFPLFLRV